MNNPTIANTRASTLTASRNPGLYTIEETTVGVAMILLYVVFLRLSRVKFLRSNSGREGVEIRPESH